MVGDAVAVYVRVTGGVRVVIGVVVVVVAVVVGTRSGLHACNPFESLFEPSGQGVLFQIALEKSAFKRLAFKRLAFKRLAFKRLALLRLAFGPIR